MWAIISLLIILTLSVLITRIAAVALAHTGLSRESARFQARSAFSGVGFTTDEAETVVNHPVRRRIILLLMLLGNAGIVTAISSLVLGFIKKDGGLFDWLYDLLVLAAGISVLWILAASSWVDRWLSRLISWTLNRWTSLTVADYTSLLHLSEGYWVKEMKLESGEWLANRSLIDESMLGIGYGLKSSERERLEEVERSHILRVLEKTNWVIDGKRGAASLLGLNPATLRSRMKKLGIKRLGHNA